MKLTKYVLVSILASILFVQPFTADGLHFESSTVFASNVLDGITLKEQTPVYSEESTESTVLRSYSEGSLLMYRAHSDDFYLAVVSWSHTN